MDNYDEYNSGGIETNTKKFLLKVIYTISWGLIWMLANVTAGLFGGYGIIKEKISLINIIYYACFFITLFILIRYLYNTWKKK
jgi:hypothetical protein